MICKHSKVVFAQVSIIVLLIEAIYGSYSSHHVREVVLLLRRDIRSSSTMIE